MPAFSASEGTDSAKAKTAMTRQQPKNTRLDLARTNAGVRQFKAILTYVQNKGGRSQLCSKADTVWENPDEQMSGLPMFDNTYDCIEFSK